MTNLSIIIQHSLSQTKWQTEPEQLSDQMAQRKVKSVSLNWCSSANLPSVNPVSSWGSSKDNFMSTKRALSAPHFLHRPYVSTTLLSNSKYGTPQDRKGMEERGRTNFVILMRCFQVSQFGSHVLQRGTGSHRRLRHYQSRYFWKGKDVGEGVAETSESHYCYRVSGEQAGLG